MSITRRAFTTEWRSANPLQPWGSTTPPPNSQQAGWGLSGVTVNETTALQHATVYGSVSLIADSVATLPLRQWRQTGVSDAVEMPVSPVIARPWAEITGRDFVIQGTVSMLLRGNLWGNVVARDGLGYPAQVQLVHPDHARVRRLSSGELEFRYWNQPIPQDDVTRAMALSVPEGIVGLNPIEYMRSAFGLARAQDLHAGAFYANSGRPDGVIEVPDDLEPEETKKMMLSWLEAHQGIGHSHLPAILTGGAKWNPVAMTLADAQFLEQMQFSESVISGRVYRIPPHLLGMVDKDTSWGSGIEQQELGFVRNTLLIWLCRWEDLLTSWLPPRQFVTFDLSQRLRGDTLQRWGAYQIARVIGAMNNAEIRKAEGLPTITDEPSLEGFDQPLNSSPVKAPQTGPGGDKAN